MNSDRGEERGRRHNMRLLIYSHDTFGMGNIRRMLAISRGLLEGLPQISILMLTGSPVVQSLRLESSERMDYIKLPCLTRTDRGEYAARYLDAGTDEMIRLRSDLILATARNFAPDLLIVDKKPRGVRGELGPTLDLLRTERPRTPRVLVLRDILDRPETVISNWERRGHFDSLRNDYDRVLILGQREIFDPLVEYRFPAEIGKRTRFCGYLRRESDRQQAEVAEESPGVTEGGWQRLLITPGGGEDGYKVIEACLAALERWRPSYLRTIVVSGPEMPVKDRERLRKRALALPETSFLDFSNDLVGLMASADAVVSMAGYNTICEILSLRKRAIVIPRVSPTEEQWLRAERLAPLGCLTALHPNELTPELMREHLERQLSAPFEEAVWSRLDLGAQEVINAEVEALLDNPG